MGEAPLPQRARSYWKTRYSAAQEALERVLEAERAQLPPWFVVGFGAGIAAWFALGSELEWGLFLCIAGAAALAGFGLAGGFLLLAILQIRLGQLLLERDTPILPDTKRLCGFRRKDCYDIRCQPD